MYQGLSTHNLDAKGRLAIPVKHREAFAAACVSRVVLTVSPGNTERCLWLYPESEWNKVAQSLAALPFTDEKAQAIKRLMLGHAMDFELDAQGRIRISPELRDFARLGKKVSVLGQVNKLEIRNAEVIDADREGWLETANSRDVPGSASLNEIHL